LEQGLTGTDRLDLNSVDLSIFSVDALEDILAGTAFCLVSEGDLLERLLSLGEEYRPLLRWIEIRFLSAASFTALMEHLEFAADWVWCYIADRLIPSVPFGWNSVIVFDFPDIFQEFGRKRFSIL
jgi:hypothetical protein